MASRDGIAVYRAGAGATLDDVAAVYDVPVDELERLNGAAFDAGDRIVLVPVRPINSAAVDPRGYQTVPILCYHRFAPDGGARHQMQVAESAFVAQMAYLRDNGYTVVPLAHVAEFLRGERTLPRRSVAITVDDGFRSFLDIAHPILEQFEYPATLFVYSEFPGAPAAVTWDEVAALHASALIDVQSHSLSHTSLARASDESRTGYLARIAQEIERPEARLPTPERRHFAYPYGDTGEDVVALLSERGYDIGVTVQRGVNASFAPPLMLKRNMVFADHGIDQFARMLRTRVDIR